MKLALLATILTLPLLLLAACDGAGSDAGNGPVPTTPAGPDGTPGPTATVPEGAVATDTPEVPPISLGEPGPDGVVVVTIEPSVLSRLFFDFVETDPDDPFFHIHTDQPELFLGIELYTESGDDWTGETGTFPTDCESHGICVYLDVDGTGPAQSLGPGTGEITIVELNEGGYDVTLTGVTFVDPDSGDEFAIVGPLNLEDD